MSAGGSDVAMTRKAVLDAAKKLGVSVNATPAGGGGGGGGGESGAPPVAKSTAARAADMAHVFLGALEVNTSKL